jgi:hypothetical protein
MKFSVITINYNNCQGLRRTMESVVGQTCADYEYIVIDGGSDDGSAEVVAAYSDRLAYWVSEKDRGIYHAMNKGVAQAHGDYCLFLNSGDCLADNTVLERIAHSGSDDDILVGRVFSQDGAELFMPPQREISLYYLYSGTLPHQGTFIKTTLLLQTPYDEQLKIVSDWKFFVQVIILQQCSVCFLNEKVAVFDTWGLSTSHPQQVWKEKQQVLSELFPPRVLSDYRQLKASECMTQQLTPLLRKNYGIDRLLYRLGTFLLSMRSR